MESSIRNILFKELGKRGVSIYRFSKDTGIPKERIYKWKEGEGNPKEEDINTIKQWLGGIEMVEDITPSKGNKTGYITFNALDYIRRLESDKEVLKESIQLSLNAIQRSQKDELDYLQKNEIHSELILKTMARIVDHLGIEIHDRKAEAPGTELSSYGVRGRYKKVGSQGKG